MLLWDVIQMNDEDGTFENCSIFKRLFRRHYTDFSFAAHVIHSTPQKYEDWFPARIPARWNPRRVFPPPAACLWKQKELDVMWHWSREIMREHHILQQRGGYYHLLRRDFTGKSLFSCFGMVLFWFVLLDNERVDHHPAGSDRDSRAVRRDSSGTAMRRDSDH